MLGLFSSSDLSRAPTAAAYRALVPSLEVALDEHQVIALGDEAMLSVVLQEEGDVEHHRTNLLGQRLVQGGLNLRTNSRMDPALQVRAGRWVVKNALREGAAVWASILSQDLFAEGFGDQLGELLRCEDLMCELICVYNSPSFSC